MLYRLWIFYLVSALYEGSLFFFLLLVCRKYRLEIRWRQMSGSDAFIGRQFLEESASKFRVVLLKEPLVANELKFLRIRVTSSLSQSVLVIQISFHDWIDFLILNRYIILYLLDRENKAIRFYRLISRLICIRLIPLISLGFTIIFIAQRHLCRSNLCVLVIFPLKFTVNQLLTGASLLRFIFR